MAGKKGMHDRTYKDPVYRERILKLIRTSQIAQRVLKYIETGKGLDKDRAQVAVQMLRKVVPDVSSTEIEANVTHFHEALERIAKLRKTSDVAALSPDQPADVIH